MKKIDTIKCSCGGKVSEVETTDAEDTEIGCGRHGCCAVAYQCEACKTRWVIGFEAPESDW